MDDAIENFMKTESPLFEDDKQSQTEVTPYGPHPPTIGPIQANNQPDAQNTFLVDQTDKVEKPFAQESFVISMRWYNYIRENSPDEFSSVLEGCSCIPFSTATNRTEESNAVRLSLSATFTGQEIGERLIRLFTLFEQAERRMLEVEHKHFKFLLTEEVLFPGTIAGYVIGKGGYNLWNIKQFTGVDLLLVDDKRKMTVKIPEGYERLIIYATTVHQVWQARHHVQALFDQAANISTAPGIPLYSVPPPAMAYDPMQFNFFGATQGGAGAYMNYGQTSAAYGQQYMNYYPTYSVPMASTPTVASAITSNATAISTATATASTPTSAPAKKRRLQNENGAETEANPLTSEQTNGTINSLDELINNVRQNFEEFNKQTKLNEETLVSSLQSYSVLCSEKEEKFLEKVKELETEVASKDAEIKTLENDATQRLKLINCIWCETKKRQVVFTQCRHFLLCEPCTLTNPDLSCPGCGLEINENKLIVEMCTEDSMATTITPHSYDV